MSKVLITGGTRGIGLATAQAFLAVGAEVLITGRSAKVFEVSHSLGEKAHGMIWDMAQVEQFDIRLNEALDILGHIDILINNAGVLWQRLRASQKD